MSDSYTTVIILTFLGFSALAAILLVPVYLFLKREERASASWTREALKEQARAIDREYEEDARTVETSGSEAGEGEAGEDRVASSPRPGSKA